MLDDIRRAADRRMVTVSIFFDFSKAFDRVHHGILLNKLKNKGLSCAALKWMASYLMGRTQAVYDKFSDTTSSLTHLGIGVPQGSVLGPLLFTLYISDIGGMLKNCKYNFYADDLQIYLHCKPSNLQRDVMRVNEDVASIVHWAESCGLKLNSNKTQAILFGTTKYVNAIDLETLPVLEINGSTIRFSTSIKYLGITVTNTLAWDLHVSNVVKNVRTKLYQLKLSKHLLPTQLKIKLIISLIFPHLDYCSAALTDIKGQLDTQLYRVDARRNYFVGCQLFSLSVRSSLNFSTTV